jgi:two-component system sensor histidine kinase KdpD
MKLGADERPDPDALLARVNAAEARAAQGRLKLFFGAAPGVGKTYAMLEAAKALRGRGVDVLIGVIESHGRAETEALAAGLERLPPREVDYKGRRLLDFDLDAALRRRPALLLIDELAHTNAPGGRHPKRWQDVEELLDAGIDVYSTLNVQHLESLDDVVRAITGITVAEKVPDRILERAAEVVLVDLPPDDLLRRLREGKVYVPDQAGRALANFFRKGNLLALRELALRRTADRVDDEMRTYRLEHVGGEVWPAQEAMLVCVGPRPGGDLLVRNAARLAQSQNVRWHAVYVEAPGVGRLSRAQRAEILRVLRLATELGAETATLSAQDVAPALAAYARRHNLRRLVLGRSDRRGSARWLWRFGLGARLARAAPELDLLLIGHPVAGPPPAAATPAEDEDASKPRWPRYLYSLLASAATFGLAWPLTDHLEHVNIVMCFLLSVVLVAMRWGRGPAAQAALVNVLIFDFFFVAPQLSLTVHDAEYLVTFAVMVIVGLVIGQLTSGLRYQARVASYREERAQHLYAVARSLSAASTTLEVAATARRFVEQSLRCRAQVLVAEGGALLPMGGEPDASLDLGLARWTLDHGTPAGHGTDTLPASRHLFVPLVAPEEIRGVLAVEPANPRRLMIPEQRRLLETFAALTAIALERVHFVTYAQTTALKVESERLRNTLLAALSHDLRTPLTALVGQAETVALAAGRGAVVEPAQVQAIGDQARRLASLVDSLLEMARLQSGGVHLRRDWQSIEELVGAALRAGEAALAGHPTTLEIPADLPLVRCDALLIERVLVNLLENAAKFGPPAGTIGVRAEVAGDALAITVSDQGPGLAPEEAGALFEKFARGRTETAVPGVGLGLAICRAIVEAHGGKIDVLPREPGHGARFRFTLPLAAAPEAVPDLDAPENEEDSPSPAKAR